MFFKKVTLVFVFWFLPIISTAQKLEFNSEFILFREAKTKQPVLIIDDSLVYKGFAMKKIAFKHTEYPAKLQEYKFFNIGSKTYLVHGGCGPVLEYRNDSIVRIDNSFLHRNQFEAVRFVYKKEMYFYGGYGLFTAKNILTKYDFKTREWIEVNTFSETPIENRENAFSYLVDNNLYVFGGFKEEEKRPSRIKLDNILWKLHLPTMAWSCEGVVKNFEKFDHGALRIYFNNQEKIFTKGADFMAIDPEKNSIDNYELKFFQDIFSYYVEGNNIVCIHSSNTNKNKIFAVIPINNIKGKRLSTSIFISPLPMQAKTVILILVLLLSCCLLLFIFRNRIKNKLKPFNGIVYNQQKELFFYKGKPIIIFEEQESRLLLFLINQNNQFVSLNDLNQLFENSTQSETLSATVKRREQTVSRLLTKVSKITGIAEKELMVERKNSEDKRIKDLKILPNLIKMM